MSVTRYFWVEGHGGWALGPSQMKEGQEVVRASDFDACAKAAVEMAKHVLFLCSIGHKWDGYILGTRAQAVIDQYGGKP